MVSEAEKPRAILGVLRARVVDVLIVDEPNARAVLDLAAPAEAEAAAQSRDVGVGRG